MPCPQRRNRTRAHQRKGVPAIEVARTSSAAVVVQVPVEVEVVSRTVGISEDVRALVIFHFKDAVALFCSSKI